MKKRATNSTPIKCECGKLLATYEDGKILVMCKRCKRLVDVLTVERAKSR